MLTGFLVIGIIVVFNLLFYVYEKKLLVEDIQKREQAIAENFFTVCQDAVIRKDDILILNYMKGIKRTQPGVRYAYLMEPSGLILTLYDSKLFTIPERKIFKAPFPRRDISMRKWVGADRTSIVEFSKPMYVRRQLAALSFIGFSNTYYEKIFIDNQKNLRKRVIGIFAIMLIVGLTGAIVLAHTMVKPIRKLIEGARAIGTGNLDQKVEKEDNSELGELAREFNRMAVNLKELDDMKKHFIASVSHELRSPLIAIEGHVDFLIEELYTKYDRDRVIDILNTIKKNSTRLAGFISNILDLSKLEAGKLELNIETLNLVNFAEEVVELYTPLARERKILLENQIPYKKVLWAHVDRDKMRQVFNNLVGNAIKFTPKNGTITINARTIKDMVEVTVADSGVGISREQLRSIFDKFMQIRPHREDVGNVKGTGLGLTIVKGILTAHRGSIRVISEPGKGSSFVFSIPASHRKG